MDKWTTRPNLATSEPSTNSIAIEADVNSNMNKSDAFIEDRIKWKAEQHKLPYPYTYYWEFSSIEFRDKLQHLDVGKPVLLSVPDEDNFVVLCTQGVILSMEGLGSSIRYKDIESVKGPPLRKDLVKSEMDTLELHLRTQKIQSVRVEKGAALFAVWNILLMLLNLS